MKLYKYIAVVIAIISYIPNYAFSGTPTAAQWGVDRTVTPWSICAYDSTNTCQNILALPSTGGGAYNQSQLTVRAIGGNSTSSLANRAGRTFSLIDDFGALCNVNYLINTSYAPQLLTATASSHAITVTGSSFTPADVGKLIVVNGIGASGLPIATTIATYVSSTQITLASPAITTVTNLAAEIAYGSDDSTAFNNAIIALAGGGRILLPRSACGVGSTIVLPSITTVGNSASASITISGQGIGSSFVTALGSGMTDVFEEPSTYHQNAEMDDMTIDAMGVANYAFWGKGGSRARSTNVQYTNGLVGDVEWGDNIHTEQNATFVNSDMHNDSYIFTGAAPLYNLLVYGGDNQFINIVLSNSSQAGLRDLSYSNNFYVSVHVYEAALNNYQTAGNVMFTGCEVDTAYGAVGVQVDSGANIWTGGKMFWSSPTTAATGFSFSSGAGNNIITDPNILGLPPAQYIKNTSGRPLPGVFRISQGTAALVVQDTPLLATTTDAVTPAVLVTDNLTNGPSQTYKNSIDLGTYGMTSVRGTLTVYDGNSGAGESWDIVALFKGGTPQSTLIGSTITSLFTSSLTLSVQPSISPAAAGINSFAITVQGVSGHTLDWKFIPIISGAQ